MRRSSSRYTKFPVKAAQGGFGAAAITEIHFDARLEHKGGFGRERPRRNTRYPALTAPRTTRPNGPLHLPTQPQLTFAGGAITVAAQPPLTFADRVRALDSP
jgi:hypothetical protein